MTDKKITIGVPVGLGVVLLLLLVAVIASFMSHSLKKKAIEKNRENIEGLVNNIASQYPDLCSASSEPQFKTTINEIKGLIDGAVEINKQESKDAVKSVILGKVLLGLFNEIAKNETIQNCGQGVYFIIGDTDSLNAVVEASLITNNIEHLNNLRILNSHQISNKEDLKSSAKKIVQEYQKSLGNIRSVAKQVTRPKPLSKEIIEEKVQNIANQHNNIFDTNKSNLFNQSIEKIKSSLKDSLGTDESQHNEALQTVALGKVFRKLSDNINDNKGTTSYQDAEKFVNNYEDLVIAIASAGIIEQGLTDDSTINDYLGKQELLKDFLNGKPDDEKQKITTSIKKIVKYYNSLLASVNAEKAKPPVNILHNSDNKRVDFEEWIKTTVSEVISETGNFYNSNAYTKSNIGEAYQKMFHAIDEKIKQNGEEFNINETYKEDIKLVIAGMILRELSPYIKSSGKMKSPPKLEETHSLMTAYAISAAQIIEENTTEHNYYGLNNHMILSGIAWNLNGINADGYYPKVISIVNNYNDFLKSLEPKQKPAGPLETPTVDVKGKSTEIAASQ